MGEFTRRLIAALADGGTAARESLQDVGELLRKARQPGFLPFSEALQSEELTSVDAIDLRAALESYCETESDPSARRIGLSILAKEGRPEIRDQLVAELHSVLKSHLVASREMFQLLLALEDVGERVFPSDVRLRSLGAIETNVKAASAYLEACGIDVPWQ